MGGEERLESLVLRLQADAPVLAEETLHRGLVRSFVVPGQGDDEAADEATVKRFFRENGRIRLQPENEALEPLYPSHVQILGKVIGVFRRV